MKYKKKPVHHIFWKLKQKSETCLGNVRKKAFPRLVSVKVEKGVSEISLSNDRKIEF